MMMLSEQRHFTGFTDHLKQSLLVSRSAVDRWVEEEKALADAAAAQSNQQLAQRQREVDAAVTHWLAVQLESGLSVNAQTKESSSPSNISKKKRELQNKVEQAQHDVEMLRDALDEKRSMLEALRAEHTREQARAKEAVQLKQKIEASKATTVNDLTRGIVNYKYLGLDFEKAEQERLRFSFTMLDPRDPHKNFSFELEATNDVWSVQECDLDGDTVNSLVGHLNETDDMLAFVRGMRRAFLKQIAARNKGSPRTGRPMVL